MWRLMLISRDLRPILATSDPLARADRNPFFVAEMLHSGFRNSSEHGFLVC